MLLYSTGELGNERRREVVVVVVVVLVVLNNRNLFSQDSGVQRSKVKMLAGMVHLGSLRENLLHTSLLAFGGCQ